MIECNTPCPICKVPAGTMCKPAGRVADRFSPHAGRVELAQRIELRERAVHREVRATAIATLGWSPEGSARTGEDYCASTVEIVRWAIEALDVERTREGTLEDAVRCNLLKTLNTYLTAGARMMALTSLTSPEAQEALRKITASPLSPTERR